MITAVIPLKNLINAKSRLAPILSGLERKKLVLSMLHDVLSAVKRTSFISSGLIVADNSSDDPEGISTILEPSNRGYDAAVATAISDPRVSSSDSMLVLPGDLPLITSNDIEVFIAGAPLKGIRIAPARDGDGTNALLLTPPGLMKTRFGPGSFSRHRALGEAVAATVEIIAPPGLAFDIDTPHDLYDFCLRDGNTTTHKYLKNSGVLDRLLKFGLLK